jgi:hypothetical protein
MQVQTVMLVQPAVNPDHDLSQGLRHVRGHLYATQSTNDWLFLGIGAVIFGTTDGGAHTFAAGNTGFTMPKSGDVAQYRKLVEMPYEPGWSKYGNDGGHLGPMDRRFTREIWGRVIEADVALFSEVR